MGRKTLTFGNHTPVLAVEGGVVDDSIFDGTPADGAFAVGNDGVDDALYVRVGGVWKSVAVA